MMDLFYLALTFLMLNKSYVYGNDKIPNSYYFDLYNIYFLDHSQSDSFTCNNQIRIGIEREVYTTTATCSKSSNIVTLTCDSYKDAYQFVSMPTKPVSSFLIKITVGNESFTGNFAVNMTNLLSPQIVSIVGEKEVDSLFQIFNNSTLNNATTNGPTIDSSNNTEESTNKRKVFNAYIVFMVAPTSLLKEDNIEKAINYTNLILPIILFVSVICGTLILWITIKKVSPSSNNCLSKKKQDNDIWVDIGNLPSPSSLPTYVDRQGFVESPISITNQPHLTTFRPELSNIKL